MKTDTTRRIKQHLIDMRVGVTSLVEQAPQIENIREDLFGTFLTKNRLYIAGNGGSLSLASHAVIDFQKCIAPTFEHAGLRAICLGDNIPGVTAWANDDDYSNVYARMLQTMADENDVLMLFSVSGESPNIIEAVRQARMMDMIVISMVGKGNRGGSVAMNSDHVVVVDSHDYGVCEDCFSVVMHSLVEALKIDVREYYKL